MEALAQKQAFSNLWHKAVDALARREHSEFELRQKLARRMDDVDLLEDVIEALYRDDLLSDERFAQMLCRSRFNRGIGPVRLKHELNQHQV
ncbi:MAG: regulatory protein RecX, partial [Arenicellales bacterium]